MTTYSLYSCLGNHMVREPGHLQSVWSHNAGAPAGAASPRRQHDHKKTRRKVTPSATAWRSDLFFKIGLEIQTLPHRHRNQTRGSYSALQISCQG